jgi:transposase
VIPFVVTRLIREAAMQGKAIEISKRMTADELRAAARSSECGRAAARMQAVAHALEGVRRCEAARLAGFERQALRDAILAYNAGGLEGLYDAPRPGRPCKLDEGLRRELVEIICAGPDVEAEGISAYTLEDIAGIVRERFGVSYHPEALSKLIKRERMSRQKCRPVHPKTDLASQEVFKKRSSDFEENCRYT